MNCFTKSIQAAEVKTGVSKKKKAWYRGQRRSDWSLLPGILRFGHTKPYLARIENSLFADFHSSYKRYIPKIQDLDTWDTLVAMQHYGVSTRLLDWTSELDTALYFA
jgi:FRG domain